MEFGILGPLVVSRDGAEVPIAAAKQRALLAILLLHAGETLSSSRLVEELWGEQPPGRAIKALQVYVSALRKSLGDGAIETRPLGYVLRVDDGALDASRFEQLLDEGRRLLASGEAARAAEVLREGLALWRGEVLADFRYEAFAQAAIGRLEELHLVALEQRLEAELAVGHAAEAVPALDALVRDHPLREQLRGLLMLALYRTGRQADALAVMQETRAALRDELGLDPSQALQRLEKAILNQDPALLAAAAPVAAPADEPAPEAPAPSNDTRKTVTVLSCDVAVETESSEALDPETTNELTARLSERVTATVARHGGTVDRFAGGEGMAVFGVPVVREDDALRAARAAVELRDELSVFASELGGGLRVEVRIGIDTGEVVAGDAAGSAIGGSLVATSRRLQRGAAAGEVLFGETTHALLAHAVIASRLRVQSTRGELTAFRLELVDPEATALPRRDDTPLVGRGRELEQLRTALGDVARGRGACQLTIVGEPGIGKSRLARELVSEAAGEATALIGRCPPYGEGITFWPLRELLAQAGSDEAILDGPTHEVFASVRRVLEELARERPVVAVFDDLHWAEPTFLDLVEDLAARLGPARVLLLCLARPQLADMRPAWLQEPAVTLALAPLSREDSEALVEELGAPAGARARIADSAEGNPLFVEQLAAIADEQGAELALPTSIRGVLHERLDRLEPGHRALLERAAVVGRSFTIDAVIELTPPEERDGAQPGLFALVRGKFVRPDTAGTADGFRFHHALIRDATYDGIPKTTRIELHQRLAEWLEDRDAADALAGYHLEQAALLARELGRVEPELQSRAAFLLGRAAQETFSRSDIPAAVSLYERARTLVPDGDARLPVLLTELASARIRLGDSARAESDATTAVEAAQRLGDRRAELRALIERQIARFFAGSAEPVESLRLASEAIEEFEPLGDPVGLARAWYLKAILDAAASREGDAVEATEHALLHARLANAVELVNTTSVALSLLLVWGSMPVPAAITRAEELLEAPESDRSSRAMIGSNLAALLAMQGSFERARSLIGHAVAANEDLGLGHRRAHTSRMAAEIELLAGDMAAAEFELRAALDVLAGRGSEYAAALRVFLSELLYDLDRYEEAEALAREAAEASVGNNLELDARWRGVLARLLVRHGELEQARRLVAEAMALSDGIAEPAMRVAVLIAAAKVSEADGHPDGARPLLEEARHIMEAKGNLVMLGRLEAALAVPVR